MVGAEHDRLVKDGQDRLFTHMHRQAVAAERIVEVPRTRKGKARRATLEIRFAAVRLSPPVKKRAKLEPIDLWAAVLASEVNAPDDVTPLEWMLLTTIEVTTPQDGARPVRLRSPFGLPPPDRARNHWGSLFSSPQRSLFHLPPPRRHPCAPSPRATAPTKGHRAPGALAPPPGRCAHVEIAPPPGSQGHEMAPPARMSSKNVAKKPYSPVDDRDNPKA